MPVTYREWKESRPARQIEQDRATQRRAQAEVAESLKTVVSHPGWLVFCQHIQALIEDLEARHQRLRTSMEEGTALGQDLERQKLALRELSAEKRAFRTALLLIPEMIRMGESGVHEMNTEAPSTPTKGET